MTKMIVIAAIAALAATAGLATSQAAPARQLGLTEAAVVQTIGHGSEAGECGRGDRDRDGDGDRC